MTDTLKEKMAKTMSEKRLEEDAALDLSTKKASTTEVPLEKAKVQPSDSTGDVSADTETPHDQELEAKRLNRNAVRQELSKQIFSKPNAKKAYDSIGKIADSLHFDDPAKKAGMMDRVIETLIVAETARDSDYHMTDIPLSSEVVEKIGMAVTGFVQERCELYRPAGKEASQSFLAKRLAADETRVLHFMDENNVINPTAYVVLGGDEEWVSLQINPGVGSPYSFLETDANGVTRFNNTIKAGQSLLPLSEYYLRWSDFDKFTMCERLNLIDGFHPNRDKYRADTTTDKITKQMTNISDSSQETFEAITNMAVNDVQMAISMCKSEHIDPKSLMAVMTHHGYELNENNSKFVPKPVDQQRNIPVAPATVAQAPTFGDEISDILNYQI